MNLRHIFILPALLAAMTCSDDSPVTPDTPDTVSYTHLDVYKRPPLYVVDGMPVGDNINFLNSNDIASMEVLKDASAAAIYGTRASNGVISVSYTHLDVYKRQG